MVSFIIMMLLSMGELMVIVVGSFFPTDGHPNLICMKGKDLCSANTNKLIYQRYFIIYI